MTDAERKPSEYVRCAMCERLINVADTTHKTVDELGERFVLRCPHCNAQSLCAKTDVLRLFADP